MTNPYPLPLDASPWGRSVEGPEQGRDEASITEMVAVRGVAGRLASSGKKLTADVEGQSCVPLWLGEPRACRVLGNGEIGLLFGQLC